MRHVAWMLLSCCWTRQVMGAIKSNVSYAISSGIPLPPSNITVHDIAAHDVVIRWDYAGDFSRPVRRFEMTIYPDYAYYSDHVNVQLLQLARIESYLRQVTIYNLHAGTMYIASMTAINDMGESNRTDNITFTTYSESQLFHPVDTLVVFVVLCMWVVAVITFLQRWGSIRIVQPRDLRYKFKPKNLDSIRVCKRSSDSVIYKSYSRQMSFTLEAREAKLERMNTLQAIQMETEEELKREKEATILEKGRVLDKDEKKRIAKMIDEKKKLRRELKANHKAGTIPTRPKLLPKPGCRGNLSPVTTQPQPSTSTDVT